MYKINYEEIGSEYLVKINQLRHSNAPRWEDNNTELLDANKSILFVLNNSDYANCNFVINEANKYVKDMIRTIIANLLTSYDIKARVLSSEFRYLTYEPIFAFVLEENSMLFFVKEYGFQHRIPQDELQKKLSEVEAKDYVYVSIMDDYAYTEIIDHTDDENDVSRGTKAYSLKWMFEQLFSLEEYRNFIQFAETFTSQVKEKLGYAVLPTLSPNTLFNYKRTIENDILTYCFRDKIPDVINKVGITEPQLDLLRNQFINKKYYKALLGKTRFAESFVTAEWLFNSFENAGKIDYTAVAMGYFKFIEQLLYDYVLLHKNQGRKIQKLSSLENENLPSLIELNEENVKMEHLRINSMLNSLYNFYNHNWDMFRSEMTIPTKKYIMKEIRNAKELRNGYFHKDNLKDWSVVIEARRNAYVIAFLILGAYGFNDTDKEAMNIPSLGEKTEFEKLAEYIDYNTGKAIYFEHNGQMISALSLSDRNITFDEYGDAIYSGIYLNHIDGLPARKLSVHIVELYTCKKNRIMFTESELPSQIYVGDTTIYKNAYLIEGPQKLIWDRGKFID